VLAVRLYGPPGHEPAQATAGQPADAHDDGRAISRRTRHWRASRGREYQVRLVRIWCPAVIPFDRGPEACHGPALRSSLRHLHRIEDHVLIDHLVCAARDLPAAVPDVEERSGVRPDPAAGTSGWAATTRCSCWTRRRNPEIIVPGPGQPEPPTTGPFGAGGRHRGLVSRCSPATTSTRLPPGVCAYPVRGSTSISPGPRGPTTTVGLAGRSQTAGRRCPLIPRWRGEEVLRGGDCADGTPDEFTRDRSPEPGSRAFGHAPQPDTRAIPSAGPYRDAGDRLRDGRVLAR